MVVSGDTVVFGVVGYGGDMSWWYCGGVLW